MGPRAVSFVERFIIQCPYFGRSTIGGSTVVGLHIAQLHAMCILVVTTPVQGSACNICKQVASLPLHANLANRLSMHRDYSAFIVLYPQAPGPPLPSLVQDFLQLHSSPLPVLMSTELSCLGEWKGSFYKASVISILLTSGQCRYTYASYQECRW